MKEVSRGYAKNFLLPQGLALEATPQLMKEAEMTIERVRQREIVDQVKLAKLTEQIEGTQIRFQARVGAGGRLFGSITAAEIADELSRIIGSLIDKRKIDIGKPLRQVGSYEIGVKLAKGLEPRITVVVEQEKA